MALAATVLPYGMRDVKIKVLDAADAPGSAVDLPNMQTLSFGETEEYETLRGDDGVVAIRGNGAVVNWTLEAGGISLAAWAILSGGTITSTGTTPALKKTLAKIKTTSKPYFQAEGQSISDSGGDFHVLLYKCRCTGNLEGEMADGKFWISKCDGQAVPSSVGDALYDFIQNETAVAIT